jgi:hypothetical protein
LRPTVLQTPSAIATVLCATIWSRNAEGGKAMKKFMALYMAPAEAVAEMMKATPEQMKQGMDAWMAWGDKFKDSIVEMGSPLGKTMKVDTKGMSAMKNDITGYSIVEAESEDDAAEVFEDHPHLSMPGAHIEVIEFFPMPGM